MLKQPLAPIFQDLIPPTVVSVAPQKQDVNQASASVPVNSSPIISPGTTPKPKNISGALPSIGVSIKKKSTQVIEKIEADDEMSSGDVCDVVKDNIIDSKEFARVWSVFALSQDTFVKQTLSNAKPVLEEDSMINLTLDNSFQEEKIVEIQNELVSYLRHHLNNNTIKIKISVTQLSASERAYTDKEKLMLLLKNNPALSQLIQLFGLEME